MTFTIDRGSPEVGWQPLVDWMTANGMNPSAVYRLDIDPAAMTATIHCYSLKGGKKYIGRGGDIAKGAPRTVSIATLPPTRRR